MTLLEYLGLSLVLYFIYQLLINITKAFFPIGDLPKRYGPRSWAVITGASDGIGKGFAFVLAKYGFSVCLLSRNPEKLERVKQEILQQYPNTQVKWIKANFEEANNFHFFEEIEKELEGLDISILVNNVGVPTMNNFDLTSDDTIFKAINVNILPQVLLTKKLLTRLINRKGYKSAIINLSSVIGTHPIPYDAVYSSCKVFNDFFSRALSSEFKGKIDILSLRPFAVSTPATYDRSLGLDAITAVECAEGSLRALGKWDFTWGHWKHSVQGFGYGFMPGWFVDFLAKIVVPMMTKHRQIQEKKYVRR